MRRLDPLWRISCSKIRRRDISDRGRIPVNRRGKDGVGVSIGWFSLEGGIACKSYSRRLWVLD